uniref:Uncharacterized protein n=1 Tax=Chenopodium quinoa TaxID=63459 RepID=A0A803M2G6_CHEQI
MVGRRMMEELGLEQLLEARMILGLKDAMVETDAQTLKSTLQDFNYVNMEANKVAHYYLAKLAVDMDDFMKLHDEPPSCVKDVYTADLLQNAV